ncbi:MAG TPA: trypsin-like peptidase domain-containing protein [Gemmatimonadales bacterium]
MTHHTRHLGWLTLAVALLCRPATLAGQDGPTLIRQAISAADDDFDTDRAAVLLRRGLNPSIGPVDALWARGVTYLAQILSDGGQEALMTVWIRWALRQMPDLQPDPSLIVSSVADAFETARAATVPGAGDAVTTAAWAWPAGDPGSAPGRLNVRPPPVAIPLNILVVGQGLVTPGQSLSLSPGTYEIQVSAPGYASASVAREVLPGITTNLTFTLQPAVVAVEGVLAEGVRDGVLRAVASVTSVRFGAEAPRCGAGAFVGRNGLLLTTYQAIRGAESFGIRLGNRTIGDDVTVAAYDVQRDIAILKAPLIRSDSLTLATEITDDQYAWGFGFDDCASASDQRLRVATWTNRPRGMLQLRDSLPNAIMGSPIIDQHGAVAGLWTGGLTAIPAPAVADLVDQARQNVAAQRLQTAQQVADATRHRFGTVAIASGATGLVTARITTREAWQWASLDTTTVVPFVFAGPSGRYRLELLVNGQVRRDMEFTVRPGVADRLRVDPDQEVAAPGQIAIAPQKGGGFPWIIAVLGAAGAGAAGFLLFGSGGGGDTGDRLGSITISVPNR